MRKHTKIMTFLLSNNGEDNKEQEIVEERIERGGHWCQKNISLKRGNILDLLLQPFHAPIMTNASLLCSIKC